MHHRVRHRGKPGAGGLEGVKPLLRPGGRIHGREAVHPVQQDEPVAGVGPWHGRAPSVTVAAAMQGRTRVNHAVPAQFAVLLGERDPVEVHLSFDGGVLLSESPDHNHIVEGERRGREIETDLEFARVFPKQFPLHPVIALQDAVVAEDEEPIPAHRRGRVRTPLGVVFDLQVLDLPAFLASLQFEAPDHDSPHDAVHGLNVQVIGRPADRVDEAAGDRHGGIARADEGAPTDFRLVGLPVITDALTGEVAVAQRAPQSGRILRGRGGGG